MKDKFKHFKEMIKTRDKDKEKFNELMKNSLHDEYMYVRETALVVGDEMIDHVNNLFDEGLIIEDIKLLYEDEDTFLWKDIIRIDGKRFLTTNVQFWKDGKKIVEKWWVAKKCLMNLPWIKPLLFSRSQMLP
tara:strand:- start:41 stop:436 length:396 start_codon:yes stop_codon:yes gene_type:complete